jgi:tetratricopeptide (TPR) repeat protein
VDDGNRQTLTVFAEALERRSAQDRAAYLERVCEGDAALRGRVEALLRAHQEAGDFLGGHSAPAGQAAASPPADLAGTVIGPYKLREQIGEGGMGLVFVAEQQHPVRRKVALKVIRPGMGTREVVARFEAERQALALMDHPHIARVLDAGATESGQPYFVMELVKGVQITDYCDQACLDPRQRLRLFVSVCQAVQHAHQKGIIHRDLKPSNVLVTLHDGTPVVKVIDFGVAKAVGQRLTDRTVYTGFTEMVGTPLYMSPEQAEMSGLDVDTRSDIYSLGVLLYELLTGTTPFDKERLREAGFDEMRRIIREEEPPKPSTRVTTLARAATTVWAQRRSDPRRLSQFLRGDLDWVVMKALAKDRNGRYATAKELADDVERFLDDRPVQASPPSAWRQFHKFARRNKGKLAAAGLVVFFLVVLGGGAGWVARDRAARQAALEEEADDALDEARAFCRAERPVEAAAAVKRARGLTAGGEANGELVRRVDQVQGDVQMAADLEEIRLARSAVRDGHFDHEGSDRRYAATFRAYGLDLAARGPQGAAERIGASAIPGQLVAALDDWLSVKAAANLPGGERLLDVLRRADPDPWRSRLREAFQRRDKDRRGLTGLARKSKAPAQPPATVVLLATALTLAGEEALAIAVLRSAQQRRPNDFWINNNLALALRKEHPVQAAGYCRAALAIRPQSPGAHLNLASILEGAGDRAGAAAAYREAAALKPDYFEAHLYLGNTLYSQGDQPGALAAYRKAIALQPRMPLAHTGRGLALHASGDLKGAVAAYRKALALDPKLALAHNNLGKALHDQGKLAEGIAAYRRAIALDPKLALAHCNLGKALHDQENLPGALAAYRRAIALDPKLALAHNNLGNALEDQGDLKGAQAAYRRAIAFQPGLAMAHYNLGNVLGRQGDLPGAVAAFRRTIALDPKYAEAYCNLGSALYRQGQFRAALAAMRRGHAIGSRLPRWPYDSAPWVRQYERVVELDARLPDILQRKAAPANAEERLELATLCYLKRCYQAAAGLYREAFAARAKGLAAHRYSAVRAAALSGCGRGTDAPPPGDRRRADLRALALGWLQDELAGWRKQAANKPPALETTLRYWQRDPDLAGVREPDRLAKLPPEERQAWRGLWAQVAKALARGQTAPRPRTQSQDKTGQ